MFVWDHGNVKQTRYLFDPENLAQTFIEERTGSSLGTYTNTTNVYLIWPDQSYELCGYFDDGRVYERVVSVSEIRTIQINTCAKVNYIFNLLKCYDGTAIVGNYTFDESADTTPHIL